MSRKSVFEDIDENAIGDRGVEDGFIEVNLDDAEQEGENNAVEYELVYERADAIDRIADSVEENIEIGIEPATGQALNMVVEQICARLKMQYTALSFEEYSTQRTKRAQTKVALESLRDKARELWKKIVEMIQRFLKWIRNLFSMKKIKTEGLIKKAEEQKHVVKQKAAAAVATPAPATHTSSSGKQDDRLIVNESLSRVLRVGLTVPPPDEMVRLYEKHVAVMDSVYELVGESQLKLLKQIKAAVSAIDSQGNEFQNATNEAFKIVSSTPAQMARSRDQQRFGPLGDQVVVYETDLIFGNKSIFRTAHPDGQTLALNDVHFGVFSRTNAPNVDDRTPFMAPTTHHADKLLDDVTAQLKKVKGYWHLNENVTNELDMIGRSIEREMHGAGDDKRFNKRGRIILLLVGLAIKQQTFTDTSIEGYDRKIAEALIEYTGHVK